MASDEIVREGHQGSYRFDDVLIDVQNLKVTVSGEIRPLEPKAFRLLQFLIENSGRVVTKEEILQAVWAGTFVTDNALTRAITQIRKALNDDPKQPKYIETVPTVGYRFLAQRSLESAAAPRPAATAARWRLSLTAIFILTAVLLAFVLNVGRVRRWLPGSSAPSTIRSILVLPLEGLSNEADLDYFADGMTDALITNLAQIEALRVISRTTAMQYKKAREPLPQIARELNVDAAVEGTAVRSGNRVRITTQLVLAREDKHIWARAYERDVEDILALQDEVAQNIAEEIRTQVTPQVKSRLASAPRVNPEAYEAYLKSRYFLTTRSLESAEKSLEYAHKSVALQPTSALFEAGLADSLVSMSLLYAAAPHDVLPQAKTAALKALQMDDALAEGHNALAKVYFTYDWNFPLAEREFRRAVELKPSLEDAHQMYGFFLSAMSRHDEAVAEMRRARDLDPLSPWQNRNLGSALYFSRRYDEAVQRFQEAAELNPNFPVVYNWLSWLYSARQMDDQAVSWDLKHREVNGGDPNEVAASRQYAAKHGAQAYWRKELADSKKVGPAKAYANTAYQTAALAAHLGEKKDAVQFLERAFAERSFWIPFLNVDPLFDNLRGDPRFQNQLERVSFPK